MLNNTNVNNNYSVSNMYSMFIVNFFLYLFLGYYLENVLAQQYGIKKLYYFLCTKSFWCKSRSSLDKKGTLSMKNSNKINNESNVEFKANDENRNIRENNRINNIDNDHFEDESKYENAIKAGDCLSILNLEKKFGEKKKALDGLNLNFYKNEIFALLGHNGAGKSTTISILCGLYESDSGEAIFNNKNVLEPNNLLNFRQKLGICPQHDVLFDNLTVTEHLEMFCVFKGVQSDKIPEEVNKALEDMCLTDKKTLQAKSLSGGQKRKLSIALALIGGSEVVFLDEPSSGMDITSRRQLWDILKKCINNRIIVLTTHYMEEAAVLGNRIGIMTNGRLKCSGSLFFLIDQYGQYISLNVIKEPDAINEDIIKFITEKISDVHIEILSEEILFRIPKNNGMSLKQFFGDLDNNMNNLRIKTYGATMPSLEDVYLNVASHKNLNAILPSKSKSRRENGEINQNHNLILKNENENICKDDSNVMNIKKMNRDFRKEIKSINYDEYDAKEYPKIFSNEKFWIDLNSSLRKRLIQIIRDKKSFMLEIICPILLVLIGLLVSSVQFVKDSPTINVDPSLLGLTEQKMYFSQKTLINGEDIPNIFLSNSNKSVATENILLENDNLDLTNALIKFNNLISPKNYTTDLDSYASILFNQINEKNQFYEFYVFANMQSKDSPIIFSQYIMNKVISFASDKRINIEVIQFKIF